MIGKLVLTWQELGRVNVVFDSGELSFVLDALQAENNLFNLVVGFISELVKNKY